MPKNQKFPSLIRSAILCAAIGSISICAGTVVAMAADPDGNSQAIQDEVDAALLQSGQQVSDQYNLLMSARSQPIAGPVTPSHVPLTGVPPDLTQNLNLSWNGASVELASKIADAIGYKFVVSGAKPAVPAVVTMVFRNEPAIWALQDIGVRIRDTATVSINSNNHEIDYTFSPISAGTAGGLSGDGQ